MYIQNLKRSMLYYRVQSDAKLLLLIQTWVPKKKILSPGVCCIISLFPSLKEDFDMSDPLCKPLALLHLEECKFSVFRLHWASIDCGHASSGHSISGRKTHSPAFKIKYSIHAALAPEAEVSIITNIFWAL